MNKKSMWMGALLGALVLLSGCALMKEGSGTNPTMQRFAKLTEEAVAVGLTADLMANPQHRVPAELAREQLSAFVDVESTDKKQLQEIFNLLSPYIKEFQGPNSVFFLQGAGLIQDLVLGWQGTVASDSAVKVMAAAMLNGMNTALDAGAPIAVSKRPKASPQVVYSLDKPIWQPKKKMRL